MSCNTRECAGAGGREQCANRSHVDQWSQDLRAERRGRIVRASASARPFAGANVRRRTGTRAQIWHCANTARRRLRRRLPTVHSRNAGTSPILAYL